MHEYSVVESLISIAVKECKKNGFNRIQNIKILVGKASGVMPEALLFAFDALKQETIAEEASLLIEDIPISGYCENCKGSFTTEDAFIFSCPSCQASSLRITAGRELDINEIEVV
jgi:hydrogenase nickel incorporation protein HypA/HybF